MRLQFHTPLDLWHLTRGCWICLQVFNQSLHHMHILLVTGTCALVLAALVRGADARVAAQSAGSQHHTTCPLLQCHSPVSTSASQATTCFCFVQGLASALTRGTVLPALHLVAAILLAALMGSFNMQTYLDLNNQ